MAEINHEFQKNHPKIHLYLHKSQSDPNKDYIPVNYIQCRVYNQFKPSRSEVLKKRYGLLKKFFIFFCIFFIVNFIFGQQKKFCGQNASRD